MGLVRADAELPKEGNSGQRVFSVRLKVKGK
jgi:hypothetical protein